MCYETISLSVGQGFLEAMTPKYDYSHARDPHPKTQQPSILFTV